MFRHGPNCLEGPVSRTWGQWSEKQTPATDPKRHPRGRSTPKPSEIRTDLVERIRREIAEGRYETAEKWDAALEVLYARWHGGELSQ